MKPSQLPLNFHLEDKARFENFILGNNQTCLKALQSFARGDLSEFIYLWGDIGSGKSHLIQAVCHAMQAKSGVYLPLGELGLLAPQALEGLAGLDFVCIDDIDAVLGQRDWEMALFNCYNELHASQTPLLITALLPPNHLSCTLPDLKSRLQAGIIFEIHALPDEEKQAWLQQQADQRGMFLSEEVAQFLLKRIARDTVSLNHILDTLDKGSLVEQRRLTIPFVKQLFKL